MSLSSCRFTDCSSTSPDSYYDGGSVYAYDISSISVKHCIFEWTNGDSESNSQQAQYGGAISSDLVKSVTLHDNTFCHCCITHGGGGVYIVDSSTAKNTVAVFANCRFLSCKGTSWDAGGGIRANTNKQYDNLITNTVFSGCHNYNGGALYLMCAFSSYSSDLYPLKFSAFYGNSADSVGKDIFFDGCQRDRSSPILFSFTTSIGNNRVEPNHWTRALQQDPWLPLALPMYAFGEQQTTIDKKDIPNRKT